MSHTDSLHPIWKNDELYFAELDTEETATMPDDDDGDDNVVNEPLTNADEECQSKSSRYTTIFSIFVVDFVRLLVTFLASFIHQSNIITFTTFIF